MRAENSIELAGDDAARMQKLLDVIEDLDDVQDVYHNAEMDAPMKVLVIGGGGREHALAWKLAQCERVQTVFVAPGNGGTAADRALHNVPITDLAALADFAAGREDRAHRGRPRGAAGRRRRRPVPRAAGCASSARRRRRRSSKAPRPSPRTSCSATASRPRCTPASPTPPPAHAHVDKHGRADRHQGRRPGRRQGRGGGDDGGRGACRDRRHAGRQRAGRAAQRRRCARRDRGVHGRRGSQLHRPVRRPPRAVRWPPARTTSASATATPAPTPAAWAPTRRRRWSRPTCTRA